MHQFQNDFIELSIAVEALRFGEFTLKSGRISPYFFNAGRFSTGGALATLGRCYADKIVASGVEFDLLFGPAYKGIPLAAVTAAALAEYHDIDIPYAFNRKEEKKHGEGGNFVGAELQGRVLIVDDVITAGTAISDVFAMLADTPAEVASVVIGLDRKEKNNQGVSTTAALQMKHNITVESLITIEHLMEYLSKQEGASEHSKLLNAMEQYWNQYGAK